MRRIAISIPILLIAAFIVFALGTSAGNPLDPLLAKNPPAPPNVIAAETARLHLDQPLIPRFFSWIGGVLQGDFGPSVVSTQDIGAELAGRFFVTLRLIALAMVIALVLAIVVGVVSAVKQYCHRRLLGHVPGLPVPGDAVVLAGDPAQAGGDRLQRRRRRAGAVHDRRRARVPPPPELGARIVDVLGHMVLPTIALALISYASWSRFQRASMLEVLNSDYIRLARAKGLSQRTVMVKHALRTALIPLVTVTALDLAAIIGGAVVTETVFQWQGMGDYLLNAIRTDDVYAASSWLLVAAVVVILFNLVADLLYAVLDPRIRYA